MGYFESVPHFSCKMERVTDVTNALWSGMFHGPMHPLEQGAVELTAFPPTAAPIRRQLPQPVGLLQSLDIPQTRSLNVFPV